jgi:hypothetical protein
MAISDQVRNNPMFLPDLEILSFEPDQSSAG